QNPVQVRDSCRNMLDHKVLCLFLRPAVCAPATRFREEQIPFRGHAAGCCCIGRGYSGNGLGFYAGMTEIRLNALGWDARLDEAFSEFRDRGLVPGRVALEHNHVYRVMAGEEDDLLAEATGRMKHRAGGRHELPVVGDWVAILPGAAGTRASIQAILPRRTQFSRKAAGRG